MKVKPFVVFPYSNVLFSLSNVITREVYSKWKSVVVSIVLGSDGVMELESDIDSTVDRSSENLEKEKVFDKSWR